MPDEGQKLPEGFVPDSQATPDLSKQDETISRMETGSDDSTGKRFSRGAGLPTSGPELLEHAAEVAIPGYGPLMNTVQTMKSIPDAAHYWGDMLRHPSKLGPTLSTIKPELAGLGTQTAAMSLIPGGKPLARGAGAVMENAGRLANTRFPTGIGTSRFQEVTPAGLVGLGVGGFLGHHLGVPGAGELGGAVTGATAATGLAKALEKGGAALREAGGYERPEPYVPLAERGKMKPLKRLDWRSDRATKKAVGEEPPDPESNLVIPGEGKTSRVVKMGKSHEATDPNGGSLMMRTNDEIKRMYDAAKSSGGFIDPDLSNAMTKRGLMPVGNYSNVPLPKGK